MRPLSVLLFFAGMLGCTPLPAGPRLADAAQIDAVADNPTDTQPPDDTPSDLLAAETTVDAPPSDARDDAPIDVIAADVPSDASPVTSPRITGSFVSSGTTNARLSGGFVWHGGGSSRIEGWLR